MRRILNNQAKEKNQQGLDKKRKRRILIVAESIDVEDSSGSKANVALIKNLHKEGFLIEVHHYTRKKIYLEGIPCIAIRERKFNFLFLLSRIQRYIQNYLGLIINKPLENLFGFSFTFFNDTESIVDHLRKSCRFRPDLVLTLSKGASFRPHYALLSLKELHHIWLPYIHDPYPFYYYPSPFQWKEPGAKQKIQFFEAVSRQCRWAAFPSLLLSEWMKSFYPDFKDKSVIIPHQIESSPSHNFQLPPYFDPTKFNIVHAGNLMKERSPKGLLEAYKEFIVRDPRRKEETRLLFLGNSASHADLFMQYKNSIPNLLVTKKNHQFDQIKKIQKEASVNVILESKSEISPFLPGKFPHCIRSERPILALGPAQSEVRRLLGKDYPFWSEVDDSEKILGLLETIYQNWTKNSFDCHNEFFSLRKYLSSNRLKSEIDEILKNG